MSETEQQSIFVEEVQKTLGRMAEEFDLDTFFVIGALETILLGIKQDFIKTLNEFEDDEESEV